MWISLPFGFVHSPYCFQRLMRQVVKHCRWARQKILQFLDDGIHVPLDKIEKLKVLMESALILCLAEQIIFIAIDLSQRSQPQIKIRKMLQKVVQLLLGTGAPPPLSPASTDQPTLKSASVVYIHVHPAQLGTVAEPLSAPCVLKRTHLHIVRPTRSKATAYTVAPLPMRPPPPQHQGS